MTHTAHTKKSLGCLPLLRAASLRVLGACAFRLQEMEPIRGDVCLWPAVSGLSLGESICKLRVASCIHPSSWFDLFRTSQSWRPGDVDWGPNSGPVLPRMGANSMKAASA
jgi:hypothetical protein